MTDDFSMAPDRPEGKPPLRRVHLLWIALAYLLLVIYGSLVPFQFHSMELGEALERLVRTAHWRLVFWSRSDCVVNVLLTVPLAFLLTGAWSMGRRRRTAVAAAVLVTACCTLLSAAIELVQVFVVDRVGSVGDVAAQGMGALAGAAAWLLWGDKAAGWLSRIRRAKGATGAMGLALPAYLLLLTAAHAFPFDLTFSPADLVHKWRGGGVCLVAFTGSGGGGVTVDGDVAANVACFAGLGIVWALARRPHGSAWGRLLSPLALGLAAAALLGLVQLLVYSRRYDVTSTVTGVAGFVAGWAAGAALRPVPAVSSGALAGVQRRTRSARIARTGIWGLALLGWLGLLVASYWRPFDFSASRSRTAERLEDIERLPLVDYFAQPAYQAVYQAAKRILLFLPLGVLLTLGVPDGWGRSAGPAVLLAVLGVAVVLEAGQLLLPSRHPAVSDVLIAAFGGCLGWLTGGAPRSAAAAGGRSEACVGDAAG